MNSLAVVAHHDDVILWMGGTVQHLRSLGWNWHVVCFCTHNLPDRRQYFERLCAALGVKHTVFEFDDYPGGKCFAQNSCEEMTTALVKAVAGEKFDLVFTHSPTGEYGWHANHGEVAEVVTALVKGGSLTTGLDRLAYFCYAPFCGRLATVARTDATHYLQLTYEELYFKCRWCKDVPDPYNLKGIGFACPNPEAFWGERLTLPIPPFIAGQPQQ